MPNPNQPFEVAVQLSLAGVPVTGLTNVDFTVGVVQLQFIDPTGASPAPVLLTAGTEYEVEEMLPLPARGTYALKFDGTMIPDEGDYALVIIKAGVFDALDGVVEVRGPTDLDEVLALAGKNVVGIPSGYDTNGNITGITLFFFATKTDAQTYIDEYFTVPVGTVSPATQALVTDYLEEASVYSPITGRMEGFIRKKD